MKAFYLPSVNSSGMAWATRGASVSGDIFHISLLENMGITKHDNYTLIYTMMTATVATIPY